MEIEPLEYQDIELTKPTSTDISFHSKDAWVMIISNEGIIRFNREDFPHMAADEFAATVIEILENSILFRNK